MTETHRNRIWLGLALALTATKLWLSRGQGVFAIGSAGLDDRLFLELAQHLVRGEWLGPYTETTLAKGPFYPLFIAGAFLVGLPLFLTQHLFYAAACGLFALRPCDGFEQRGRKLRRVGDVVTLPFVRVAVRMN